MALQMNYYQPEFEIIIYNCYWKIESENGIQGGKTKLRVRFSCYKNKSIADISQNEYSHVELEFVPDLNSADNFIKQAYLYAKTLPFFSGAVDV